VKNQKVRCRRFQIGAPKERASHQQPKANSQ
jgi:hypothetical protein